MIGIFDSGVGGFASLYELHRLKPYADIVYLADRKNAPYGKKKRPELISLVTEDIRRLTERGAKRVLIACCTASTVWEELGRAERNISVPIIRPAAEHAASVSKKGIAVIATEATVASGAFGKEISRHSSLPVTEISAQELVTLVEGGCRDGRLSENDMKKVSAVAEKINKTGADTLVLGCTHFSHLEKTLSHLTEMKTVSPARVGAHLIAKDYLIEPTRETGRVTYL